MIVVDLRHVGTTAWLSEVLKISVRTSVSCAGTVFSTRPGYVLSRGWHWRALSRSGLWVHWREAGSGVHWRGAGSGVHWRGAGSGMHWWGAGSGVCWRGAGSGVHWWGAASGGRCRGAGRGGRCRGAGTGLGCAATGRLAIRTAGGLAIISAGRLAIRTAGGLATLTAGGLALAANGGGEEEPRMAVGLCGPRTGSRLACSRERRPWLRRGRRLWAEEDGAASEEGRVFWRWAGGRRSRWRGMWGLSAWGRLGRRGAFQLERDDETQGFLRLHSRNRSKRE